MRPKYATHSSSCLIPGKARPDLNDRSENSASSVLNALPYNCSEAAGAGMLKSIEGIFRDGKIELLEPAPADAAGARVVVTFLPPHGPFDLRERQIDESQASDLRRRLATFAEDW